MAKEVQVSAHQSLISIYIRFSLYFCLAAATIGTWAVEEKQYKDYDLLLSTHDGNGQ